MNAISLTFAVALAACTPSPKESAMPSPSSESGTTAPANGTKQKAAVAPPQVALEGIPLAAPPANLSAEAEGRRTLSTAFVRVGPDGHLTVELRDGRVLVLRNVVMRAKDYCGVQVSGGAAGAKYCGGYAEVAAARPGGGRTGSELPRWSPGPSSHKPRSQTNRHQREIVRTCGMTPTDQAQALCYRLSQQGFVLPNCCAATGISQERQSGTVRFSLQFPRVRPAILWRTKYGL